MPKENILAFYVTQEYTYS